MAEDTYLTTKQLAEWGLSVTVKQLLLKHLSEKIHAANTHQHLLFNFTYAIFVLCYCRPRLRRRGPFLQADISLKRYCPWKIWPFYSNVNTDQRPKIHNSLTETVYRYVQYIKHISETEFCFQNTYCFSAIRVLFQKKDSTWWSNAASSGSCSSSRSMRFGCLSRSAAFLTTAVCTCTEVLRFVDGMKNARIYLMRIVLQCHKLFLYIFIFNYFNTHNSFRYLV